MGIRPTIIIFAAALGSSVALAHGDFKSFSDLQSGMLHPFLDYLSIMVVAVAATLIADCESGSPGPMYSAFGAGLVGASYYFEDFTPTAQRAVYVWLIAIALLLVFRRKYPPMLTTAASLGLGISAFLPFADDASELSKLFVVGMTLVYFSAFSWMILISRKLTTFSSFAIAKRVLGSWVIAACVMLLALSVRKG